MRSHWMRINRNSHWMRIQSIHFHRWFEAGLKVNCIITWNNAGVIFLRVMGYVKKPAIRQALAALLCCFAWVSCFICYAMCNEALYALWPCSAISVVIPTGRYTQFECKAHAVIASRKRLREAILQFSCIITS